MNVTELDDHNHFRKINKIMHQLFFNKLIMHRIRTHNKPRQLIFKVKNANENTKNKKTRILIMHGNKRENNITKKKKVAIANDCK